MNPDRHAVVIGRMVRTSVRLATGLVVAALVSLPGAAGASTFSFALIGDVPYADADSIRFARLIDRVNEDDDVQWVIHAGDIKRGGQPCTDAVLEGRLERFNRFDDPFILTPGDNDWTDCHRKTAGRFDPLERLRKLRSLFYPRAGMTLRKRAMRVESQASLPEYSEFVENVRWERAGVHFATIHIVGSRNGLAAFQRRDSTEVGAVPVRTERHDAAVERRTRAGIAWIRHAFAVAGESGKGLFLALHAAMGLKQKPAPDPPHFQAVLDVLREETERFGRPVVLANGDSHYFRIDKPLRRKGPGRRLSNFTRVETFGASDVHWIEVTVDPASENVFSFEQRIVKEERTNRSQRKATERTGMATEKQGESERTPQDIIDAMHRPSWCVNTAEGRLYWDLIGAAIRNSAAVLREHLREDPDCARLQFWYTPPIHFAVREGSLDATKVLWEAYAHDEVSDLIAMADDRGHTSVADYLRKAVGEVTEGPDIRLHEAVKDGDHAEVERLLEDTDGIESPRDAEGRTALHLAVIANNRAALRALLDSDVDVDAADHAGFRAIHYTYWKDLMWHRSKASPDLAGLLLNAGARDSPALAAARGDLDAVKAFVAADPSAVNDGENLQKRPLSAAVERGHRDIVRFLLDNGADPGLPESRLCPYGASLMTATVQDDLEVARWLLEAGADPNGHVDSSGSPAIRARSDAMRGLLYGYGGRASGAWGYVQRGDFETVAAILRYTDDPFTGEESEYLTTPYTAVISGCGRMEDRGESTDAHEAMFNMFLQRKHPMPRVLTACKTYLYHVPRMTRRLLENGLDPNLHDWQRRTPLHDLCRPNRAVSDAAEMVRMFLEFGADVNAIDEEDRSTPLGIAAREGNAELVGLLLDSGADPNAAGAGWATPLAWAKRRGHEDIARLLRSRGAR
ncbi:MAG: ankyrin repeat domain-containing protein [Gemmatimonadota bacterium]|nr:ankyrin repeat domain-containing protein [Gemmatimonadota bacterium]